MGEKKFLRKREMEFCWMKTLRIFLISYGKINQRNRRQKRKEQVVGSRLCV